MIKNIIFDFGGIILDLHYTASFEAVSSLLDVQMHRYEIPQVFNDVFEEYEKGLISSNELHQQLQILSGKTFSYSELVSAWNAMLLDIPMHRLDFLKEIQKEYRIYLLSNTNAIHMNWVSDFLQEDLGIAGFNALFTKAYYSHIIKMRKPDAEIFQYVLKDSELHHHETLFIDDSKEHIETASQLGICAKLHDPETEIEEMIGGYIDSFNSL